KQKKQKTRMADRADVHELYQESVQGVEFELDFVDDTFHAIRGRRPKRIREDFCGTALSASEWVTRSPENEAVGVDIDPEVLDWGREHNAAELKPDEQQRLELLAEDVMEVDAGQFDVVQAFNFSYWFFQERESMKAYFQRVYESLVDDGIAFFDVFGGFEAHQTQREKTKLDGFTYIWEQASYNPLSAEMVCYIHFHFPDGSKLKRAFTYHWRLWGAKELREILAEVGFRRTRLYVQAFDDDTDEPIDRFDETEVIPDHATFIAYLVAEK
ncbi:MAG: class I SAM-dependent methyltransferase, partial [Halofilum sp. (in: g-proteobacteria)]|nr:class I SAM-dependent methyltransferase [Halofilum sp. (in: g-proteobacteria)]